MNKLDGVHPVLVQKVLQIQEAFKALGIDWRPTNGVRTAEEQFQLWRQGREIPGPDVSAARPLGRTVTNADGIDKSAGGRGKSNHQPHSDGLGHAVDGTFWIDGRPRWRDEDPWLLYGLMAEELGLKWGGRWKDSRGRPKPDNPHIEYLPEVLPGAKLV